ncbi:phosphatidylglycerophosphatase A [Neptunicella sp. SCSIO 80796]|uniref:phosphatidylglycerophosphatase A family protein n=1 Tax=Neptunicella plasticusilytica TaxID=3117012 RepID=UPI003A4D6227
MDRQLRQRIRFTHPAHFLALGFGSGLASFLPGTFGTLAAIPLYWLLSDLALIWYVLVAIISSVAGIWICGRTAIDMGVHDHSAIVWDEVAGFLITMIAVPLNMTNIVAGFILFRLFDILKPWPISYLDKHVHGGFGIMADDVLAGVFAMLSMHGLLYLGWLG